ncbi:ATP-dependent RNA helicase HrpB, partial [Klebsiella pneumoniae]
EQAERAAAQSEPEILHSDLSALLLELLQWGCHDPAALAWLDQPPAVNLAAARRLLEALSALDGERLSAFGRKMAALGNEPRLAAMLATAQTDVGLMAGLLASAFADRIARRRGQEGRYQLANGMGAMLDADDALGRHEWLIAPLLLQGSASPDARMLLALPVDIGELIAARPELAKSSDTVEWDEAQGTLKAWRRTVIGQLVIKTQPLAKPSEAELHQAMLNGIREKGLGVLNWTPEAEQLRLRLHCAAQWLPEEAWPAVDDASLLASLEAWLLPQMNGVHSLRALKALDLRQALQDWLPWPLRQKLDRELPTHYTVPTGSRLAIRYHAENPPALAVRMQEMFGEATTPVIAEGRVPLVLELLSPAQRPLQITRDLSAFWQGSYREVQKEMKGRYPKHVWPDDPANAAPTRRSKKYS